MTYFQTIMAIIAIIALVPATWIPLHIYRVNKFNVAATKLREVFLPVRIALNPAQFAIVGNLDDFLESHFQSMRAAVLEFSDILDTKTKTAFLQAWYEYYCHQDCRNEKGVPFFEQYYWPNIKIHEEHEMKKLIQSRIEKILKFAKHK